MKGTLEEYGTSLVAALIGFSLLSFFIFSIMLPEGEMHRFAVVNMENYGAKTQVVLDGCEWDIEGIKVVLKDDGGLYFTGSGVLPSYDSVDDTPWAAEAGNIDFVNIEEEITVSGKVPIN